MKKVFYLIVVLLISKTGYSQVKGFILGGKEFSKEIALYNSKEFLFRDVLGSTADVTQFELASIAAASSGELTTLLYKCEQRNKEGLILGFYGNYWNENGVVYQGYGYKNLGKEQAIEFLNKIELAILENSKFLNLNNDHNVFFRYDDIDVLIYNYSFAAVIRLFWNGFDSEWEQTAYFRSKKRFEKNIK